MFKKLASVIKNQKEVKLSILILGFSIIIFLLSTNEGVLSEGPKIQREDYSGKKKEVVVVANTDSGLSKEITINVNEKVYSEDELEKLFETFSKSLEEKMISTNKSLSEVREDLFFCDSIEGYPFFITYRTKNHDILTDLGEIVAKTPGKEKVYVTVSYGDFIKNLEYEVTVIPSKDITEKRLFEDISDSIEEREKNTRSNDYLDLPTRVDGVGITYTDDKGKRNPIILLAGFLAAALIIWAGKADERKKTDMRKELIRSEYPIMIRKLVMYLSSGMSFRNVWYRICDDFTDENTKNPLYEEMKVTKNELRTGIAEGLALENFKNRINMTEITRFVTIVIQNQKRGSTNLSLLLYEEVNNAFEEKRRRAMIKGEEAGTKLLAPTVMLLVVVMMVIMIPAFWNI